MPTKQRVLRQNIPAGDSFLTIWSSLLNTPSFPISAISFTLTLTPSPIVSALLSSIEMHFWVLT